MLAHHRGRLAASAALTVILLAACGTSPGDSSEATTPPVTDSSPTESIPSSATAAPASEAGLGQRHEVEEYGFALELPDGWTVLDLTEDDVGELLDRRERGGARDRRLPG